MEIRPAISSDITPLMDLNHSDHTDHVWQMSVNQSHRENSVTLREVRLPRPIRVEYPRDPARLADDWTNSAAIFVAEGESTLKGYMVLETRGAPDTGWLSDIVVDSAHRRHGIGTRLLAKARRWCAENGYAQLTLEMQNKNHPYISLARKLGFVLSGFHDTYYPDEDIALFYSIGVR